MKQYQTSSHRHQLIQIHNLHLASHLVSQLQSFPVQQVCRYHSGMPVITFRQKPCNRAPSHLWGQIVLLNSLWLKKCNCILSLPKCSGAFGSGKNPIYPNFAFYCSFKKQFFRKTTSRNTFRNHYPKTLCEIILIPYTQILAFYCIFKKKILKIRTIF